MDVLRQFSKHLNPDEIFESLSATQDSFPERNAEPQPSQQSLLTVVPCLKALPVELPTETETNFQSRLDELLEWCSELALVTDAIPTIRSCAKPREKYYRTSPNIFQGLCNSNRLRNKNGSILVRSHRY